MPKRGGRDLGYYESDRHQIVHAYRGLAGGCSRLYKKNFGLQLKFQEFFSEFFFRPKIDFFAFPPFHSGATPKHRDMILGSFDGQEKVLKPLARSQGRQMLP